MNTGETIALIKAFGGSGSSLPPVSASDNGKVLAVEDGAWAAGSNLFVVTITNSTADKTRDEIVEAVDKGKNVIAVKGIFSYNFDHYEPLMAVFTRINTNGSVTLMKVDNLKGATEAQKRLTPDFGIADTGKILKVIENDGSSACAWVNNKFIVTLTPTSPDFSGTMDKTVAEINAAYEAGMEIWFFFELSGQGSFEFPCDAIGRAPSFTYPSFNGGMYYNNTHMRVNTLVTDVGTKQTYATEVYSLTPAS